MASIGITFNLKNVKSFNRPIERYCNLCYLDNTGPVFRWPVFLEKHYDIPTVYFLFFLESFLSWASVCHINIWAGQRLDDGFYFNLRLYRYFHLRRTHSTDVMWRCDADTHKMYWSDVKYTQKQRPSDAKATPKSLAFESFVRNIWGSYLIFSTL